MIALSIFLLLLIAIAVRFLGRKWLPLLMPPGRLTPLLLGWTGAAAGSLVENALWPGGPSLGWLHPAGAATGALLFLVAMSLLSFFRVLLGKAASGR